MNNIGGSPVRIIVKENSFDIVVHVFDNGPGLSDEVIKSIFQRRVTTKPGGSEFGLMFSYWCVKKYGGDIRYERDGGSHFMIMLKKALITKRSSRI